MSKQYVEVLEYARTLLVDHGWTQGCHARDADGYAVTWSCKDAACYCSEGAILHAIDMTGASPYAYTAIRPSLFMVTVGDLYNAGTLPWWNDSPSRTYSDVIRAFDNAIEYWKNHRE